MKQSEPERLRLAAHEGDPQAQYELAMAHIYGNGVEEDNGKALALLEKAAAQGLREAIYNLGICYHYGYGTAADVEKAFALYLRSAELGYGKGCSLVGEFYYDGRCVAQDYGQAVQWFLRAARSEDAAYAEFLLGRCCELGHGMEQDSSVAMDWYEKSATHGDDRGKRALARLRNT